MSSHPLRARAVRAYLFSRFCSGTAMTMLRAGVAWHVFALTKSPFYLGLVGLVQFLPAFGLVLVGGAVADTRDRRAVMMTAQAGVLLAASVLLVATWRGWVTLPLLYAVVATVAAAAAFDGPARASLLPSLVPREVFPRAVTIAATTQALSFATGPALGGVLIAAFGIEALYGAYALLPVYADQILQVGPRGYGLLASSMEVGALLASLALVVLPPIRRAGPALLSAVTVFGVATIVFGWSRLFPLSIAAYMVVGIADQVSVVLRGTAIQLATPDAMRGRVSAVNLLFIGASNQLGAAESGFLAGMTSATFAVVSGGFACLVVVAVVAITLPALRRYRVA